MAKVKCPSCGTEADQQAPGAKIVCAGCGGSFTFVAGETKLDDMGEFDQLKKKVGDLEAGQAELRQKLRAPPADPPREPPADDDPASWDETDDEEDL